MKLALFILAFVLATAWAIGLFVFSAGVLIHVLLISAALFLMPAIIINPRPKIAAGSTKTI